jgi:hypothetical protein
MKHNVYKKTDMPHFLGKGKLEKISVERKVLPLIKSLINEREKRSPWGAL